MAANARHATGAERARRRRPDALSGLRRPGVPELLSVTCAAVVLIGVALAGGSRATGGPPSAGIALAIDHVVARSEGSVELTVTVANDSRTAFTGRVTAHVTGGERSTGLGVPAGASRTVELTVPAACDARVTVTLDGPDGEVRRGTAVRPCGASASG